MWICGRCQLNRDYVFSARPSDCVGKIENVTISLSSKVSATVVALLVGYDKDIYQDTKVKQDVVDLSRKGEIEVT
jgi:hypothetical protein